MNIKDYLILIISYLNVLVYSYWVENFFNIYLLLCTPFLFFMFLLAYLKRRNIKHKDANDQMNNQNSNESEESNKFIDKIKFVCHILFVGIISNIFLEIIRFAFSIIFYFGFGTTFLASYLLLALANSVHLREFMRGLCEKVNGAPIGRVMLRYTNYYYNMLYLIEKVFFVLLGWIKKTATLFYYFCVGVQKEIGTSHHSSVIKQQATNSISNMGKDIMRGIFNRYTTYQIENIMQKNKPIMEVQQDKKIYEPNVDLKDDITDLEDDITDLEDDITKLTTAVDVVSDTSDNHSQDMELIKNNFREMSRRSIVENRNKILNMSEEDKQKLDKQCQMIMQSVGQSMNQMTQLMSNPVMVQELNNSQEARRRIGFINELLKMAGDKIDK